MSKAEQSVFARNNKTVYENQEKKEKRDWLHAENQDPEKFDGTFETGYYTTIELEKRINKAFRMMFSDYYGCAIVLDPSNNSIPIKVSLFFQPKQKEAYSNDELDRRAFVQVREAINDPQSSGMQNLLISSTLTHRQREREFALTEYAAEVLYDFVSHQIKKNSRPVLSPFNPQTYTDYISETINTINYQNVKVCAIECVDINNIISFIYGSKKDNSKYVYTTALQKPLSGSYVPGVATNWLVSITRMTFDQLNEALAKTGVSTSVGTIRINTDEF